MHELCQKHGLSPLFEKIYENQRQKQFRMRLVITNPNNKKSLTWIGICNTVQNAKHSASKKAIADDFVTKLKNTNYHTYTAYTGQEADQRSNYNESSEFQSYSDIRVNDAVAMLPLKIRVVDDRNYIYEIYLAAKRLNLKPRIELVSSQRGSLTSEVVVKIIIGNRTTIGKFVDNNSKSIKSFNFKLL